MALGSQSLLNCAPLGLNFSGLCCVVCIVFETFIIMGLRQSWENFLFSKSKQLSFTALKLAILFRGAIEGIKKFHIEKDVKIWLTFEISKLALSQNSIRNQKKCALCQGAYKKVGFSLLTKNSC